MQCVNYVKGAHIVLKFCHGLNPQIQDDIACLIIACLSDDSPKEWYDAAILYNENCVSHEAFMSMQLKTHPPKYPLPLVEECKPSSPQPSTQFRTFQDAIIGTPMATNNCFAVLAVEELEWPTSEVTSQPKLPEAKYPCLRPCPKWKR